MSPLEEAEQVPFLQRRSLLKVFVLKTSKLLRTHSLVFQITVRVVPWLRFDIHTLIIESTHPWTFSAVSCSVSLLMVGLWWGVMLSASIGHPLGWALQ